MATQLRLGDLTVDVVYKDIKNIHLSVYPPAGRVRIAVPRRMSEPTIRAFAAAKLPWIREQQHKLREQERESNREYRRSHRTAQAREPASHRRRAAARTGDG